MARAGKSTSTSPTRKSTADVDSYIGAAPKAAQPHLRELRKVIKSAAPKAAEKMSYGIPFYEYRGRLIYFAGYQKHVALYPASEAKGLERYQAAKATLRFPLDEALPVAKIRSLVRARVKERDAATG
jgi:uncharacterized protein YdhG (YjbR/CyaY superfamily)